MVNNSLTGTIPTELFTSTEPLQLILSRNAFKGQLLGDIPHVHGENIFTSPVYGLLLDRMLHFNFMSKVK